MMHTFIDALPTKQALHNQTSDNVDQRKLNTFISGLIKKMCHQVSIGEFSVEVPIAHDEASLAIVAAHQLSEKGYSATVKYSHTLSTNVLTVSWA